MRCVFAYRAIYIVFWHPFRQYKQRSETAAGLDDCAIQRRANDRYTEFAEAKARLLHGIPAVPK